MTFKDHISRTWGFRKELWDIETRYFLNLDHEKRKYVKKVGMYSEHTQLRYDR